MAINFFPPFFTITLIIAAAFFLSGASALIYQILWVRGFSLAFGHTTLAVSAVLSAFMGGLAAGNFISGKISKDIQDEKIFLALFAALEVVIALAGGFVAPLLIKSLPTFIIAKFPSVVVALPPFLTSLVWFAVSFFILIIPTTLMGATLPILVRYLAVLRLSKENFSLLSSRITSFLIAINTAGSVVGVVAAGFYLIQKSGMSQSYRFAALVNIISAILGVLVLIAHRQKILKVTDERPVYSDSSISDETQISDGNAGLRPSGMIKVASLVLFLSGMAGMITEVAWTRVFSLILGSATYSFSIILAVYLTGFTLGNLFWDIATSYFFKNNKDTSTLKDNAFLPFVLIGVAILGYMPLINYLPYIFVRAFPYVVGGRSVLFLRVVELLLAGSIMLLPTFFMGMIFPWVVSVVVGNSDKKNIGHLVGKLQGINTLGNIVGSAIAGLILIVLWGSEKSLVVACVIYFISGGIIFYLFSSYALKIKVITLCAVALVLGTLIRIRPGWDPYVMTSGMFNYANLYTDFRDYDFLLKSLRTNWLLYYKDGVTANVAVFQTPWKERFIRINGKTDASTAGDMPTQLLLAYIPSVMVRPRPAENVLIVGLGSGITAGSLSVALKDVKSIECVEIEPSVQEAAKFFVALNHQILDKPFFRLIFTDARHYLGVTNKKYDIIISEPSNPWISGIANLFTVEAFQLGAEKLTRDGIFCQWLQSYSISEEDFKLVMRTFASVFKRVALFATAQNDYLLVGTNNPDGFDSDYLKMKEMFDMNYRLARDLEFIGINKPFSLITTTFMLDDREFRDYAFSSVDKSIHTDDRPTIEFTTPLYLYKNENDRISTGVESARKTFVPAWLRNATESMTPKEKALLYNESAEAFLRRKKPLAAKEMLEEAIRIDDKNPRLWVNLGRVENLFDNHLLAENMFKRATQLDPNYPLAWFHLGMLYHIQGLKADARRCLEKGLRLSPGDPMGSYYLSSIYMDDKLYTEAKDVINKALSRPIWDQELRDALTQRLASLEKISTDKKQ